jgi:hypothetical protein
MYCENSDLFVRHLTEAAAEGETTGDYSRYHAIQRQLAAETAAAMLSPYAGELSALARDRALKEAESRHSGFSQLLNENREVLHKNRPALAEAIAYAEQDPRLQKELLGLYDSANDFLGVQNAVGAGKQSAGATHGDGPLSIAQITKLPLAERSKVLDSMRENLGDTPVDVADTSNETQLRY